MAGFGDYLKNVWSGLSTTLVGMGITFRYIFTKPVTVQYPEERMQIAPRYRGIHYLEQDLCIACRACEKACPIDCIEIRFERHPGSVNEWYEFSLDYNKCMFCELCCFPCPKTCIHMGREFSLVKYHRNELVHDLLTWTGMRDLDRDTIEKAEIAKAKKAEEARKRKEELAAKKAAEAKAAAAEKKKAEAPESKPDAEDDGGKDG